MELAAAKTEIVMLTQKRIPTLIPMTDGGVEVQLKPAVRHLDVMLDCRLTWWEHIQICEKAVRIVVSLSRLVGNVCDPRASKRRLITWPQ